MDKELLRNLQLKELEIVKEIQRICEKNNIDWMLTFGSVLGAIRHEGFIPWDDDIDICMREEEYKKFVKACKSDLNTEKFFLQTIETDPNYPCSWGKVRMNNTCSMDNASRNKKMHWGICVDIFKVQYAPRSEEARKKLVKLHWLYNGAHNVYFESFPPVSQPKEMAKNIVRRILRISLFRKMLEKRMQHYCKDTDKRLMWDNFRCRYMPAEFYENSVLKKFEDEYFPCPEDSEGYCEMIYGDWKQFPPEDQRYGHPDIIVDLEKSYTEYMQ